MLRVVSCESQKPAGRLKGYSKYSGLAARQVRASSSVMAMPFSRKTLRTCARPYFVDHSAALKA